MSHDTLTMECDQKETTTKPQYTVLYHINNQGTNEWLSGEVVQGCIVGRGLRGTTGRETGEGGSHAPRLLITNASSRWNLQN